MTSAIDVPIDAAPVQRCGRRVERAATGRLRTLMAAGVVLSVATAATQVVPVAPPVRAAVTLVFAMVGPGAAVVATLLLCGATASRDGRAISFRLPPVVLAALVVPASVTVLVMTAQTMLWLQVWRPAAALVVLAIVSAAPLLAAATALVRSGSAVADDGRADAPAGDLDTVGDRTADGKATDGKTGDGAVDVRPDDPDADVADDADAESEAEPEAADGDAADGSGDEDGDPQPQPHSGETAHAETAPYGDTPQLPHLDETTHTETAPNGDDRQAPDRAGVPTGSAS